jgi:hypothetical protein
MGPAKAAVAISLSNSCRSAGSVCLHRLAMRHTGPVVDLGRRTGVDSGATAWDDQGSFTDDQGGDTNTAHSRVSRSVRGRPPCYGRTCTAADEGMDEIEYS